MKLLRNAKRAHVRLEIVYVPVADIQPNPYNPNVHDAHSFDMLCRSIGYFGFTQPVVVDRGTQEIVDGENRWRVASILGLEEIPVCYIELTEDERRAATIIHNRARGREVPAQVDEVEKVIAAGTPGLLDDVLLKDRG